MTPHEQTDMFYRANVATQLLVQPIAPEHIADALTRANQIIGSITFGYAIIDKPEHGFNMHFIITPVNGDQLPGDGYNWLDDEMSATHQVDPTRFLIVHERRQGVAPGEQHISMTRRRYELLQNNQRGQIQFVHYLAADPAVRSAPINPGAPIKMPARRLPFPTYDQMQHQEQPPKQPQPTSRPSMPHSGPPLKFTGTGVRPATSTASGAAPTAVPTKRPASSASGTLTSPPPASRRKSGHPAAGGGAQQPDRDSYLYDESPQATGRDIAVVRFTRNHEWLEQLWNPTSVLKHKPSASAPRASSGTGDGLAADNKPAKSKLATMQARLTALRAEVNTLEHGPQHEALPAFPGPVRKWVAEVESLTSVEVWSAYVTDVVNVRAIEHGFDPIVPYVPVRAITLAKAVKDDTEADEDVTSSAMDVDSELTGASSVAGDEQQEDKVEEPERPVSAKATDVDKVKAMDTSGASEDNSSLGSELDDLLGVPMEQRHHQRQQHAEGEGEGESGQELTDVHMSDLESSVARTASSSATSAGDPQGEQ